VREVDVDCVMTRSRPVGRGAMEPVLSLSLSLHNSKRRGAEKKNLWGRRENRRDVIMPVKKERFLLLTVRFIQLQYIYHCQPISISSGNAAIPGDTPAPV
jgi:hypothetical protein